MKTKESDIEYCKKAILQGSLSFHAASLALPESVRTPCLALYAFCRLADDEAVSYTHLTLPTILLV